jgi:hypothetical protein
VKLKRVHDFDVEQVEEGVLVGMVLSRTFVVAKESNRGKATSYEYMG